MSSFIPSLVGSLLSASLVFTSAPVSTADSVLDSIDASDSAVALTSISSTGFDPMGLTVSYVMDGEASYHFLANITPSSAYPGGRFYYVSATGNSFELVSVGFFVFADGYYRVDNTNFGAYSSDTRDYDMGIYAGYNSKFTDTVLLCINNHPLRRMSTTSSNTVYLHAGDFVSLGTLSDGYVQRGLGYNSASGNFSVTYLGLHSNSPDDDRYIYYLNRYDQYLGSVYSLLPKLHNYLDNPPSSGSSAPSAMDSFETDYLDSMGSQLDTVSDMMGSGNKALPNGGNVAGFMSDMSSGLLGSSGSSFSMSDFSASLDSIGDTTSGDSMWSFFSQSVADSMVTPSGSSAISVDDDEEDWLEDYIKGIEERWDKW